VVGAPFDLIDFGHLEPGLGADSLGVLQRDQASGGHCFACGNFNLEPDLVFALIGPDRAHFG
jgi:hypothetical protein